MIVVPDDHGVAFAEVLLQLDLQGLVLYVAPRLTVGDADAAILRIGLHQRRDANGLLIAQRSGELLYRQDVVERVGHLLVHGVFVLQSDPWIHLVDVPCGVPHKVREIQEVRDVEHHSLQQLTLHREVKPVAGLPRAVSQVIRNAVSESGIRPEALLVCRDHRVRRGKRIPQNHLWHALLGRRGARIAGKARGREVVEIRRALDPRCHVTPVSCAQ